MGSLRNRCGWDMAGGRLGRRALLGLGTCLLAAMVPRPACALPPEGLRLVEGATTFHQVRRELPYSVITLRLRNEGQMPIEAMRLLISFSSRPLQDVLTGASRERLLPLKPPLMPGGERVVTMTERGTKLHSALKITEVLPALHVTLNGVPVALDPPLFIRGGQVYGPIADLARPIGWRVEWSEAWQTAAITSQTGAVVLQLGSGRAVAAGSIIDLGAEARDVRGKMIVPLRHVLVALGAAVAYDEPRNRVRVEFPQRGAG